MMNGSPGRGPLITTIDGLPPALAASISAEERAFIQKCESRGFPFAVTPHFASLAEPSPDDPIRRQFIPDPREAAPDPFGLEDPLGEALYRAAPRFVHQYRDRALLLAGGTCAGFCRHCFRRVRMSEPNAFITPAELEPVLACLASRPEIREVLVSGGDPLTADNAKLDWLFARLRSARHDLRIRLCTRVPITCPARLDPETIALLGRRRPLRIVTHINHPRELAPEARACLSAAVAAGIPVYVQTVLLRGVNDSVQTLAALFAECSRLGLVPYYLFQLDLAPGTAHFRVPLADGLALYRELERLAPSQNTTPGPRLPVYAVDLPGGGGKIRLREDAIARPESILGGDVYLLKDSTGKLWPYPAV